MKRMIVVVIVLLVSLAGQAMALDLQTGNGSNIRNGGETGESWKHGKDQSSSADITLAMDAVFRPALLAAEIKYEPWKSCRVLSHPLMPADVGLSWEIEPGDYDTIKADSLNQAAKVNDYIANFADEAKIKEYRKCLALYGAVIAASYQNLNSQLANVATTGVGGIQIRGLGQNNFRAQAIMAVEKTISQPIGNKRIRGLYHQAVEDSEACRFGGDLNTIVCGGTQIILGPKPHLTVGGVELYGDQAYGLRGNYTLKAGKTTNYDQMDSEKTSWDRHKESRQSLSPTSLLGQILHLK